MLKGEVEGTAGKAFCGEGREGPDGVTDVWERGMTGAGRK